MKTEYKVVGSGIDNTSFETLKAAEEFFYKHKEEFPYSILILKEIKTENLLVYSG